MIATSLSYETGDATRRARSTTVGWIRRAESA
jgi:hypothetical protein